MKPTRDAQLLRKGKTLGECIDKKMLEKRYESWMGLFSQIYKRN